MKKLESYLIAHTIDFTKENNGRINIIGNFTLPLSVDHSALQSVGGDLDCERATEISLPQLQSVGGYLDCRTATEVSLPQLQSVGWYLNLRTAIIAKKRYDIEEIDGLPGLKKGDARDVNGFKIQKIQIAKNYHNGEFHGEICYVASNRGINAHGDTIRQAIADVEFKGIDREAECRKYKKFTPETVLDVAEWYKVYRNITGACSTGAWNFINSGKFDGKYNLKQVIDLTNGQYNHNMFVEFFGQIKK